MFFQLRSWGRYVQSPLHGTQQRAENTLTPLLEASQE